MDALLLTPPAPGAIAVYLLSGSDSLPILQKCCGPKALHLNPGDIKRIFLHDGQYPIDDALVICMANDIFELHLHGGVAVIHEVAALFRQKGGTVLDPQSEAGQSLAARGCGLQPYHHGIGADILSTLPLAKTKTAVDLLAHQLTHGLALWRTTAMTNLANRQFPLWQFHSDVQWLLDRSQTLQFLFQPPRIAIVGPPNAGKSTLANALLGRPVSITSDIPGTTRDWVDGAGILTNSVVEISVVFLDTAGIRETSDSIEHESIHRSRVQLHQADAAIVVLDGAAPNTSAMHDLLQTFAGNPQMPPTVIAINKSDKSSAPFQLPPFARFPSVRISALTHVGLPELMSTIMQLLGIATVNVHESVAFAPRQQNILNRAALTDTREQAIEMLKEL